MRQYCLTKIWTDRSQVDIITNSDQFSEILSHY